MPNTFKKYLFCGAAFLLAAANLPAQTSLNKALPLLQKKNRTAAQTQQVLTLLRTSTDPNTVFAAGASLVKGSRAGGVCRSRSSYFGPAG